MVQFVCSKGGGKTKQDMVFDDASSNLSAMIHDGQGGQLQHTKTMEQTKRRQYCIGLLVQIYLLYTMSSMGAVQGMLYNSFFRVWKFLFDSVIDASWSWDPVLKPRFPRRGMLQVGVVVPTTSEATTSVGITRNGSLPSCDL
jgi:hypothetical protein